MPYQHGYGVEMQDESDPRSMKEFGAAFLTSLQEAAAKTTAEPPLVVRALREHFGRCGPGYVIGCQIGQRHADDGRVAQVQTGPDR